MHRLRTVTSLDVSAVAGHHAMPAALLFYFIYFFFFLLFFFFFFFYFGFKPLYGSVIGSGIEKKIVTFYVIATYEIT